MSRRVGNRALFALNMVCILSLYMYSSAGGFESAAVQSCIEAWPEVSTASIRMMLTLPALVQAAVMMLSAPFLGKRIRFRTAAMIGMLLISLGGGIPFFYHPTWSFVILCRAIGLGGGGGFLGLRNALMLRSVPADQAGKWVGAGTAAVAIMSVAATPVCGALTELGWQFSFLVNIPALLAFVLITLFLREPLRADALAEPEPDAPRRDASVPRARMHLAALAYAVILLVTTCALFSVLSGLSTFYAEERIGSAALAGAAMSCYSLTGVVVNLLLPRIQRLLGRRLLPVCTLVTAAGIALIVAVPGAVSSFVGMILSGAGYFPTYSVFQIYNGELQPPERLPFSSMLILTLNQIAIFISSYFIELSGVTLHFRNSEVSSAMIVASAIFLVLGLLLWVVDLCPKRENA